MENIMKEAEKFACRVILLANLIWANKTQKTNKILYKQSYSIWG